MEYLIGSMITLIAFLVVSRVFRKEHNDFGPGPIRYSQSNVYELIKPYVTNDMFVEQIVSQATKHYDRQHIRVVLADNQAYWILDNVLYVADQINGAIDKTTTKPVDTISMDKVQLEKMIIIVEALTEGGDNENRNSRN